MSYSGFTLPKGFGFRPSDEELLSHYLEKKNQRKDSQITAIIPEIDVCEHEPRDLPALVFSRAGFRDREWFKMADSPDMGCYFFSPRVYKHSKSKSKSKSTLIRRTTKEGYWKIQGTDRRITGACSDKQIGGKRILTFYLSKKQKTDWVIHEYYLTDTDSDEQFGDFVLCCLKDNRLKNQSGKKKNRSKNKSSKKNNRLKNKSGKSDRDQQNAAFCGGGEPSSSSCRMVSNFEDQASKGLRNVHPLTNDNDVEAEHDGSSCSTALHVENPASKQLENVLPVPNGHVDDAEQGGGICHIASGFENGEAEYSMLTEAEVYQAFEALRDILGVSDGKEQELRGSQTDPCYKDNNHNSFCVEGQPDSLISPDSEMVEELLHNPPTSPQMQSPIYTKLGTTDFLNDESRKRKCPFEDSDPLLMKKNHIDEVASNTSSNSENQAADAIPEEYPQSGKNLGNGSLRSQELLSENREPRDFPLDNCFIVWDDLQSLIEGFDDDIHVSNSASSENQAANVIPKGFSLLGSDFDSFLENEYGYAQTSINGEPRDISNDNNFIALDDLQHFCKDTEISLLEFSNIDIDGGGGVTYDGNTKGVHESVNDCSPLAFGASAPL